MSDDDNLEETPDESSAFASGAEPHPPASAGEAFSDFSPPADYEHPPEFEPAAPREIPKRLKQGSHATRNRGVVWTLLVLGAACLLFHPLPFVKELAYYILVLKYLDYIGYGLLGIAATVFLIQQIDPGRFKYVQKGVPVVGRVLSVGSSLHGNAQIAMFKFLVTVEYRDPETEKVVTTQIESEDSWQMVHRDKYSLELAPGDYVTLVGLPENFAGTLKIYDMLGLNPEREAILKNGRPITGMSSFTVLLIVLAVFGGFGMLMMGIYALEFCFPFEGDWTVGIIPGIIGAVVGFVGGYFLYRHEQKSPNPQEVAGAGCLFAGCPFLGILAALVIMVVLNAKLDTSAAEFRGATVVQLWEETWTPVFIRNFKIEYREDGQADAEKLPSKKETLQKFGPDHPAVIEIGAGRFGWKWVRGIHPIAWEEQVLDGDEKAHQDKLQSGRMLWVVFENPQTGADQLVIMQPKIELPDGSHVDLPDDITEKLIEQELRYMQQQMPQLDVNSDKNADPPDDSAQPDANETETSEPTE